VAMLAVLYGQSAGRSLNASWEQALLSCDVERRRGARDRDGCVQGCRTTYSTRGWPPWAQATHPAQLRETLLCGGAESGGGAGMDAMNQDANARPTDEVIAEHSLGHRVHISFCTS
jgi:hypothetical protein